MGQEQSYVSDDTPPVTLADRTLDAVADYIKSGRARRIVAMTGAGISTAAGIPDFRSPETGLYANLAALDLPEPEAVFDLAFFRENPKPFYALARELYPGARYRPTVAHVFLSLLARRGLLHMLFTQNIDCLERAAGVPAELLVEAHGSFASSSCVECKAKFDDERMREFVARGEVPRCEAEVEVEGGCEAEVGGEGERSREGGKERKCGGLVKPDIVFFGEALPRLFFERTNMVKEADLVLVMGTSLQVHPFAGLPNLAEEDVPRVLFNLERVGSFGTQADDVLVLGDCDAGVRKLADALGWRDELEKTWRELVGEEEAERQLQGAQKRVAALHDEVEKLAEEVEEVLHIDGRKEQGRETEQEKTQESQATSADSRASEGEEKVEAQTEKKAEVRAPELAVESDAKGEPQATGTTDQTGGGTGKTGEDDKGVNYAEDPAKAVL